MNKLIDLVFWYKECVETKLYILTEMHSFDMQSCVAKKFKQFINRLNEINRTITIVEAELEEMKKEEEEKYLTFICGSGL